MLSFRSRVSISAAAFFVTIGLAVAVDFLGNHPDEKIFSDFHRNPIAFALGLSMIGAAAAILLFFVLLLVASIAKRWPSKSTDGGAQLLYSPNQALCASMIGGPLAAVSMFKANYLALKKPSSARKAVAVGLVFFLLFTAGIITLLYKGFALKDFGTITGVTYSLAAKSMMASLQLDKKAIVASEHYSFRSNWKVVGVGALYLTITILILFIIAYALTLAGYHIPQ